LFEGLKKSLGTILNKLSKTELKGKSIDSLLWEFKLTLLENDVALSVTDIISNEVKNQLQGIKVQRFEDRRQIVERVLREIIHTILLTKTNIDLLTLIQKKRKINQPFVIAFLGVNGTGKTTTIGKVAYLLLNNGYSVVLAGCDTFRAGSIEQLEGHAKLLGIRMIKHSYGADAAAVAFDAISHAKAHGIDVVLIDTAGRMQTNRNLMTELRKIIQVNKPDLTIFVGDALTGNDAVEQAKEFINFVPIDASILTKIDADAKGGSAISIAYITKRPIIFLGTGQNYDDLIPFNPSFMIEKIFDQSSS
jgi:fused signal recognition particle receptor